MGQIQGCPLFIRSRAGPSGKAPSARPLLQLDSRLGWAGVTRGRARAAGGIWRHAPSPSSGEQPRSRDAARAAPGPAGAGRDAKNEDGGTREGCGCSGGARGKGAQGAGSCPGPRGGRGRMPEPRAKQAGGRGAPRLGGGAGPPTSCASRGLPVTPVPVVSSFQETPALFQRTRGLGGAATGQGLRLRSQRPSNRCGPAAGGEGAAGPLRLGCSAPHPAPVLGRQGGTPKDDPCTPL